MAEKGYLKIATESDRMTVCAILYKNGYSVKPVRRRKNPKTLEKVLAYELPDTDIVEESDADHI